jgi:hypothetical protein
VFTLLSVVISTVSVVVSFEASSDVADGSNEQVPIDVATTKQPATKLIWTLNLVHSDLSLSIFVSFLKMCFYTFVFMTQ